MKSILILALISLSLAGCASDSTSNSADAATQPSRSYSREQLERTGQPSPAEAFRQSDPAVTIARGH